MATVEINFTARARRMWLARIAAFPLIFGLWLLRHIKVDVVDERGRVIDHVSLDPRLEIVFSDGGKIVIAERPTT